MNAPSPHSPNFRLDGQVALVTGASRGIGNGLARALAAQGARVAVAARDMDLLVPLAQEIDGIAVKMDVRSTSSISQATDQVFQQLGKLDILVANAGLGDNKPALEVTETDWDDMMQVNLRGLFFCCQAAARHMVPKRRGRIITMSSQASLVGIRDHAVYCASKGGVNQLTRVLALEWGPLGITVNAVAPTFIYTPGTSERLDQPEYLKSVVDRIPVGEVGQIRDVAGAVIYLASDAGRMVNGSVLPVDGGWTAQ
jgi:NAD(P)-dependent dehydrogenase (short-subunit alcohol dehydrogenase family)